MSVLLQPPAARELIILLGKVSGVKALIHVDGGASGNFISSKLAHAAGLRLTPSSLSVMLANGRTQPCDADCWADVCIGTYCQRLRFHVTALSKQFQVVLGKPWLAQHNPAVDWSTNTLCFRHAGTEHVLQPKPEPSLSADSRQLTALQVKRLMRKKDTVAYLCVLQQECPADAPAVPPAMATVLQDYADVFAPLPDGLPPSRAVEHAITLKPDIAVPVRPYYRMSMPEQLELKRQLQELQQKGWIEPAVSSFGAGVLLVKKKDGTMRLCVDYRALNKATVKDVFPLPRVDDVFDQMKNAKFFSKLDMQQGYHQMRVKPDDVHKTAFRTRFGNWSWLVMPFGLCNAPASWQRLMQVTLEGLERFCAVYLDDIAIWSATADEHVQHVTAVLQRLRKHRLFAKMKKCVFMQPSMEYLGHVISVEGISMDPSKVKAILQWPAPSDVSQLRSFLGLAGYYRRFCRGFSGLAAPLTALQGKGVSWRWEEAERAAFEAIKHAIASAPVLKPFDPDLPTEVTVDASEYAVGAVMHQGKHPHMHPVAFESRKMTPAERRYPVHEQEALALVHALKIWRHYLMGRSFKVKTDNWALKYLKTQPTLSSRQARWLYLLEEFDFELEHIPGRTNVVADALSRRPDLRLNMMLCTQQVAVHVASLMNDVLEIRQQDAAYMELYEKAQRGSAPASVILGEDDLLYWRPSGTPHNRLYVPEGLRETLLSEAHDPPTMGHLGMDKTLERLSRRFFWPKLEQSVRAYVRSCPACQRNKASNQRPAGLLQPLPIPDRRWESVSMDFVMPLPKTQSGHEGMVVFVDRLSKRIHISPCSLNITAPETAQLFFDTVFKHHGLPKEIVSDRDSKFTSNFWRALWKLTGTQLKMSSPYHPQTDGQTERANRVIEDMLRAYVSFNLDDWDKHLTAVEFAYNNSQQASTRQTPFMLDTGQHPHTPLDMVDVSTSAAAPAAEEMMEQMNQRLRQAMGCLIKAQERQKKNADASRREEQFVVGDLVYVARDTLVDPENPERSKAKKLQPKHYGPYPISKVISDVSYEVKLPAGSRRYPVFHVSMLRRHHQGERTEPQESPTPVPAPAESPQEDWYEVEAVLDKRLVTQGTRTETQYLIKWKGYPDSDNSWEPAKNVARLDKVKEYNQRISSRVNQD